MRGSPASITRGVAALPSYTSLRIGPLLPEPWPGTPTKTYSCDSEMQAPQVTSHLTGAFCNALHGGPQALSIGSWVQVAAPPAAVCANPVPPQSRGQLLTFSAIFPPSGWGAFYKSRGSSSFLAFSLASYHTIQLQSTRKSTRLQNYKTIPS